MYSLSCRPSLWNPACPPKIGKTNLIVTASEIDHVEVFATLPNGDGRPMTMFELGDVLDIQVQAFGTQNELVEPQTQNLTIYADEIT